MTNKEGVKEPSLGIQAIRQRKELRLKHKDSIFVERQQQMFEENGILLDKDLFWKIDQEFDKKIVQEHEARQSIFLVTNLRNVENIKPESSNLLVSAGSGTGKDHISQMVFDILPSYEKEERRRITPKVLSYLKNKRRNPSATWNKIALRLEDVSDQVLNDDVFKVMSSSNGGKITIIIKNKPVDFIIDGKPSIVLTCAETEPKHELLRRFPICSLDESIDQTKLIMERQANLAKSGISLEYDKKVVNALKKLQRVKVKIPFADELVRFVPNDNVIMRTNFQRFLDYIKSSCALYQFQREVDDSGYYLATAQDYIIARIVLMKTTSNIKMIPLTQVQQKILDLFRKLPKDEANRHKWWSIAELEPKVDFCGDTHFRNQLNNLSRYGFLKKENEVVEKSFKPILTYQYQEVSRFHIPDWNELLISENGGQM